MKIHNTWRIPQPVFNMILFFTWTLLFTALPCHRHQDMKRCQIKLQTLSPGNQAKRKADVQADGRVKYLVSSGISKW